MMTRSVLALGILWVSAAFANGIGGGPSDLEEGIGQLRRLLRDGSIAGQDFSRRRALEEYEKRGAEIARWPDEGIKPRPGNAALLYYQALVHYSPPDPCTLVIVNLMGHGRREPDDRVRSYLGDNLRTIQLTQLASQVSPCDWGLAYDYRLGFGTETITALQRLRVLFSTHIRTLAADGHYQGALENGLALRRLARHIGDETHVQYLVSRMVENAALHTMLYVLSSMPSDEDAFVMLRDQLDVPDRSPSWLGRALNNWCDLELREWRLFQGDRAFERSWALEQLRDQKGADERATLSDQQLLIRLLCEQQMWLDRQYGLSVPAELFTQARHAFDAFVDSAVHIMESDIAYDLKQQALKGLERQLARAMNQYEPVALLREGPTRVEDYHRLMTSDAALFNCLRAALEIRLIGVHTGQLPETLPGGVPSDPFTGKDLEYERTDKGFVIRIDPAGISDYGARTFEFAVSRP